MAEKEISSGKKADLRRQAEEIARGNAAQLPAELEAMSSEEIRQTLHELKVHQIELEMQNDELRRAHTALDALRARYFDLYDLAPVGYLTVSKQGLIMEANLTAATLLGLPGSVLVKRPLSGFILKEDDGIYYQFRKQLFETSEPQAFELRMVKKNGPLFWAYLEATVAQDAQGEPLCLVVLSNINRRKQAEEALRESGEQLRAILDATPFPIALVDIQDNIIDFWSRSALTLFGHIAPTAEEWYQIAYPDPDYRSEVIDRWKPHLETARESRQTVNTGEYRVTCRDGSVRICELYATFLADRLIVTFNDITARRHAEAQKAILESQNRELQKAESLGRMAGAIAHHFNNQLGVVIGNLDLALTMLPVGAGPIEKLLTAAMKASQKAAEISGLMLTYLGQSFDARVPLDLSDVCQRSLPMLRNVMPGNVVIETALPSPGPVVSADANQIQQVFTNLITNARESIGDSKGAIFLSVKIVSPLDISPMHRYPGGWQAQDNDYACLEVRDTGSGITDNDREKLFDPFFSTKFTGRGMGLPVVLGIVKVHGGVITVESKPGQGSTFRVFFPVSAEEVLRQPDKAAQSLAIEGGGTVLLVEDEEALRKMVATILNSLGYAVLEAKDGVEAVEIFRQHQNEIRCVLSDLTMPRLDGWETLTALRKIKPGIPVILASGYDKAQVMAGDHPELPQVFLGKPYKIKGLSDAISQALDIAELSGMREKAQ